MLRILEILLIYYIGNKFHGLSIRYEKNKWLYPILGVICYCLSSFIGNVFIRLIFSEWIKHQNFFVKNLAFIPISLIGCLIVYKVFQIQWEKEKNSTSSQLNEISDIGKEKD